MLIAAVLALAEVGPGELSLDHALGQERTGPGWAVLALALGVAGAVGAHIAAESTPAPPAPPEHPVAGRSLDERWRVRAHRVARGGHRAVAIRRPADCRR